MTPLLPLKARMVAPILFLAVVGGVLAIADRWMRLQPSPALATRKDSLQATKNSAPRRGRR